MQPLERSLRNRLETAVKQARRLAEAGARAVLNELGVAELSRPSHLTDAQRDLRVRLRAHGRQLGDSLNGGKQQTMQHLLQEMAYQHWHRMLFARFLAENGLLMYDGVAVTLEECEELAADEAARTGWELAGRLAERMLPQIFKTGSPVFELALPADVQIPLEAVLAGLPAEVFTASDSLGWVYQFWQADNKDAINKSEVKIGADELPAVTQLFTEPYMVAFLLHNSLGAWWATRHPGKPCPVSLEYLRTVSAPSPAGAGEGRGEGGGAVIPAAGTFEGWPESLADFKLLDPCCGSGHFLVAAFLMLVPMRMAAEALSAREAVGRVLADNLHGLELDARCVEIAVFAVALEAWRYPDERGQPLGVREIPNPHIACCGLKVAAKAEDWQALVSDGAVEANQLREGLAQLHQQFAQAPLLGSLLSPSRNKGDMYSAGYAQLEALLHAALKQESSGEDSEARRESALSALGLLEAAQLLEGRYHLVITNVPYLARGKQAPSLRNFADLNYPQSRNDLANMFLERGTELADATSGVVQVVMPQNWLFQASGEAQRTSLLKSHDWLFLARLGVGAFETISGEVVNVVLLSVGNARPTEVSVLRGIDCSARRTAAEKSLSLLSDALLATSWRSLLKNPRAVVTFEDLNVAVPRLGNWIEAYQGLVTGDIERFSMGFYELPLDSLRGDWLPLKAPISDLYDQGCTDVLLWQGGTGSLHSYAEVTRNQLHDMHESGNLAWGRRGIAVNRVKNLRSGLYFGEAFHNSVAVAVPKLGEEQLLPAMWAFFSSEEFISEVRKLDSKLSLTNRVLLQLPFDVAKWTGVAEAQDLAALSPTNCSLPTQWLFHGHPQPATDPLQVAVARLLGYRWPAEVDEAMELAGEARALVEQSQSLLSHADKDGIVCIPPVGGEKAAADRLLNLLAAAYGPDWNNGVLTQLLASAGQAGKTLDSWLREKFFAQHCDLFHQRPFIWHIWDGLRDGFAALVNYHRLDTKTLEALIYTYLGNWISRQTQDAATGVDGAQEKLDAAQALKQRLELILKGEQPHDIFVRWKPLDQQPVGWAPDLNDGVRLNIRPFLSVPDVGKKGAGVLRERPKVKWDKDRGSDVPTAPWYGLGLQYGGKQGDRINDHHLSLAEKQKAREAEM